MNAAELYRKLCDDHRFSNNPYSRDLLRFLWFEGESPVNDALLVRIAEVAPEWFGSLEWWIGEQLLPDEAQAFGQKVGDAAVEIDAKSVELDREYARIVAPAYQKALATIQSNEQVVCYFEGCHQPADGNDYPVYNEAPLRLCREHAISQGFCTSCRMQVGHIELQSYYLEAYGVCDDCLPDCPRCGGAGYTTDGEPCPTCEGTGVKAPNQTE